MTGRNPGDLLVRVGALVFGVGALATLVTVTPLFLGADPLPTAAYLLSMLMGVGFLLAAAGLLRAVRGERRQSAAVAARSAPPAARQPASQAGKAVRSGSTTSAPACRNSRSPHGPVATATDSAPAAAAPRTSPR